jgi:thioredoxin-like negative regulator of GroEL
MGQKADKGFKNLEKNDIIKAQESFTKALQEDSTNCAVNLGIAIVLSHENNAAADYFKAWDHFLISKKNISKLTEDDNATLKSFFTLRDAERRNKSIQYNIDVEEKIIEDKLIKFVREENKLEVAEHFIAVYPNSKFYENVVHIRNHLEYRKAEKANTLEAYTTFLNKYPDAAQKEEAHKALNELAFQQAKKTNTVEAFDDFIKKFPEAYHYYDAIKLRDQLAFDLTKKQNTIEAFDKFLAKYPNSLHVPAAKLIQRKLLFDKAKQVNTLEAYNDFILRYPEGEFFVDIFNLKTNVLGQNMLADAEGNKEIVKWIKGFDSELKNDSAGGISLTADNRIVVSGTRNKIIGTEAWVISLDNEGKTLWNKSFGSMPQNRVKFQVITPKGDILLGGWSGQTVDTFARKVWLFEISNTGVGKWERNVDGIEANAVSIAPTGEVYMAGYSHTDSLQSVPFLMKLNNDYQKLWSREYVRSGMLSSFAVTPAQNAIMGEGNWIWKTDPLGYIVWEKLLPVNDSIVSVNSIIGGTFYLTGSRSNSPYLARINDLGAISWEKNFSNLTGLSFDYATLLADKSIFVRYQGDGMLGFMTLSDKGEVLKDVKFKGAAAQTFSSLAINAAGEIFTVFTKNNAGNSEIIVCKLVTK